MKSRKRSATAAAPARASKATQTQQNQFESNRRSRQPGVFAPPYILHHAYAGY